MSLMEQYADIYGIDIREVKQWCNDFANGNVPESVKEWMEPTKKERIESIKSYIQEMVDNSLTAQVKAANISDKILKTESKEVAFCPF